MSNEPVNENRPTEITAAEFVEQDYKTRIANGECQVIDPNHEPVNGIWDIDVRGSRAFIMYPQDSDTVPSDYKLTVRWLDSTAAPASTPAPEDGTGDGIKHTEYPERQKRHKTLMALYEQFWAKQQDSVYISEPMSYEEYLEWRVDEGVRQLAAAQAEVARLTDENAGIESTIQGRGKQ